MNAIIQCRLSSSRLNKKSLQLIGRYSLLEWILNRLNNSNSLSNVIISTSTQKEDDEIVDFAVSNALNYYRGSLEDVGDRLLSTALFFKYNSFVRICGDSPFLDWRLIDNAVKLYDLEHYDLVTNVFNRTYPKGQSVEIIRTSTFEKYISQHRTHSEKEHPTTEFYTNYYNYKILSFTSGGDYGSSQHSIDTQEDLVTARNLVKSDDIINQSWLEIETSINSLSCDNG